MLRVLATALAVIVLTTATLCFSAPNPPAVTPGITLVGKGVVSGSALDTSGLAGNICQAGAPANCVPKAIFGGFGSDLTYTGHDNVFIAAPDRGPFDGSIYKIDLNGATDVSANASLPAGALPAGVTPVTKSLFINLLDADLNLSATIPEKIEGLSWAPDLPDGRHLLYVISDNDLNPSLATQIYAFAIEPALLNFQQQLLPDPLFPPHQMKTLVK